MSPRVLLLGGHGKVSLLMTPLLTSRSWHVISVIRNPAQTKDILDAGSKGPGKVEVLVSSLEDVKSQSDAQKILDQTKPDYVIWSAGAGGQGGPERTYAIDRDAAIHFITASTSTPSITKFLMISALSERRARAPWWNDDSWALIQKMNTQILPHYYKAKLAADEALTLQSLKRIKTDEKFQYIDLRPGGLSDEKGVGKVQLGKIQTKGMVPRADVAEVAVRLLERGDARGWFDLLGGGEEVGGEVERVVGGGVDSMEGEDLSKMGSPLD